MDDSNGHTRSTEEIRQFIDNLADADQARLMGWARYYAAGTSVSAEQLLAEAMSRALVGSRRCRSDLSIMVFFRSTIRSIISGELQSAWNRKVDHFPDDEIAVPEHLAGPAPEDPERSVMLFDAFARLSKALESKATERDVLTWRCLGMSPDEIQQEMKLTPTQYASALRQIRRTADKLFGEEGKS